MIINDDSINKGIGLENKFAEIFHISPDAIAITRLKDGKYADVNDGYLKLFGYSSEELIGNTATNFHIWKDPEELKSFKQNLLELGEVNNLEVLLLSKTGQTITCLISARRIELNGEIYNLSIARNISDRKAMENDLRKSEERFKIIASNTPDHIIMHDKDLRYTFVLNPQLGLTEEDMIGKTDRDFLPEEEAERLISAKKQVLETGHPMEFETSLVSSSGTLEYFSGTFVPSFTANGEVDGLIGYFRNITEQKIVQETLAREKRRLENIITGTNTGTWELDLKTGNSVINERWAEILGYTLEELAPTTYETWSNLVHPDDLERARDAENEHFDGRSEFYEAEFRMRHKDGYWVWVLSKGKLIARAADGKPYLMYGTHQDITERKNAEQSIRESSEQFQTLISTSLDGFFINDASGAILEANPAYCQMLGYQPEELLKLKVSDIDVIETPEMVAHHIAETIRKGSDRFEARHRCKDGQIIDVEIISTHVPSRDINLVFIHNITEQKLAQANLALEKQRLADIITATNAGTWEWNIQTGENIFNDRWPEMIGYTLDEISPTTYETWLKIVHPDDLTISLALLEKHFKGELDYYECELRMRHKDGHWVWVIDRGKVTKWSDDGKPLMMYGTHQDITKRKEAEVALQENKEMLSLFISNSPIFTFIKEVSTAESRVLQVSDNYFQMIGIPSREMVGKTMEELFPLEFAAKIAADDWAIVKEGKPQQLDEELNGRSYTTIKFPIHQHDRTLLAGYTIDITERKQAENELLKHQKLLEESQNIARLGSFIVDFENNSRYWTREMFHIFAMDDNLPPPAFGEFQSLIHPDDVKYEHDQFMESKQTGSKLDITYRIITYDGETRFIHELGTPETDPEGKVLRIIGSIQDITKSKLAEERLHESESRFRTLADLLPVGVYLTDLKGDCLYANGRWLDIAGLTLDEAGGPGWSNTLHPEDKAKVCAAWKRMVDSRGNWGLEYRFMTPEGKITWVYGLATPLKNEKGEISGYVGANMDITERKLMQDILQASLVEKDVLLREVHHRVKNNLAAILGLLEMERQNTADPNAGKLLIDLSNRIKAMSTVHEKLYRSENLARIDFQDYLKSFLSHLRTSFVTGREITTKMEAEGIELSLDIAVPCGLIINELVTNALKYAFPNGKPGVRGEKLCEIRVSMDQEDSTYTLVVSDNGVGLPKNIDWREANSLGLRLVRMLGEHQLGGEIELDKSRGTRFMIRFNTKEREL
jgi:PAS domain S-box-containing protein